MSTQISDVAIAYEEIRRLEPIFHTKSFGLTVADAERMMVDDYCEIGASGRIYNRSFILEHLAAKKPVDAEEAGWRLSDFGLRTLCDDTFLATYTLHQGTRITQRSTIWGYTDSGWKILYHQGTLAANAG